MEKQNGKNIITIRTLSEIIPEARKKNAELEASSISTSAFFLDKIYPGQLYSVVGMTNSGKTWWSLGTAISLAREGKQIGYITTEDTTNELVSYLDQLNEDEESLGRIELTYVEDINEQGIRDLIRTLYENGCDVIILDYLRPDLLSSHHGDLNLTMGKLFKVLRGLLELLPITIIQTIQANAALYNKGLLETFKKNPDSLFTMIDGGYTAAKRSQIIGLLVKAPNGKKGVLVLKAKSKFYEKIGKVFVYGNVQERNFNITYDDVEDFESFMTASSAAKSTAFK